MNLDYFSGVFNWESSGITPYSATGMYGIELELKSSELLELKDGTPYSVVHAAGAFVWNLDDSIHGLCVVGASRPEERG